MSKPDSRRPDGDPRGPNGSSRRVGGSSTGASSITEPSNCSDGSSAPANVRHPGVGEHVEPRLHPGVGSVDHLGDHGVHIVDRDGGHMVVERIECGGCRPACPHVAGRDRRPARRCPLRAPAVKAQRFRDDRNQMVDVDAGHVRRDWRRQSPAPDRRRRLRRRQGHAPTTSQSRVASLPSNTLLPLLKEYIRGVSPKA